MAFGPVDSAWQAAWEAHLDAWDRIWAVLRQGATLGQIEAAARVASAGSVAVHARLRGQGLGDDLPLLDSRYPQPGWTEPRPLETGTCFLLEPCCTWTSFGREQELSWGDTVLITEQGPRRLGSRPHELVFH